MIGLTYIDNLELSSLQWVVLCLALVIPKEGRILISIMSLAAFWDAKVGKDQRMLWDEVRQAKEKTWANFLDGLYRRKYIHFQNPFLTFMMSRSPFYRAWQVLCVLWFLILGGMVTPLSLMMMTQPSHDSISFLLTASSWLSAHHSSLTASLLYGIACIIKTNVIMIFPFMAYRIGGKIMVSAAIVTVYWWWFLRYETGRRQLQFLQFIAFIGRFSRLKRRWKQYRGSEVVLGFPFFLFPLVLSFSWPEWVIFLIITLLAPNLKYYLLLGWMGK